MLAAALAAGALLPAGYLLLAALPILSQGGWLAHFASTTLPHQSLSSLAVALEAAALAFAVGAVPAVLVSRFEFRGRGLVGVLALLPLLFALGFVPTRRRAPVPPARPWAHQSRMRIRSVAAAAHDHRVDRHLARAAR